MNHRTNSTGHKLNITITLQMDSGGPLLSANAQVNRYFLAGLVSYGLSCGGDDPSVNTRVYSYVNWIASATGGTGNFYQENIQVTDKLVSVLMCTYYSQ